MKRLTERVGENGRTVIYVGEHKQYDDGDIPCEISDAAKREILKRLAAYEDLEEQGRLVVLPCKVGTVVWSSELTEIDDDGVEHVAPWSFVPGMMDEWGKSFFLTREEAEKALKGASEDA